MILAIAQAASRYTSSQHSNLLWALSPPSYANDGWNIIVKATKCAKIITQNTHIFSTPYKNGWSMYQTSKKMQCSISVNAAQPLTSLDHSCVWIWTKWYSPTYYVIYWSYQFKQLLSRNLILVINFHNSPSTYDLVTPVWMSDGKDLLAKSLGL